MCEGITNIWDYFKDRYILDIEIMINFSYSITELLESYKHKMFFFLDLTTFKISYIFFFVYT